MSRVSAEAVKFNVAVLPATPKEGKVYRIYDIFTTRDGSWEPSNVQGSIPQWARDTYLRPWGAADYFDDAGADHHILAGVIDAATQKMVKPAAIHYWTWTDNGNHTTQAVKEKSGWANIIMFNSYNPDLDLDAGTGERGAWAWAPSIDGIPADVVVGGGMPFKWHVSFFTTFVLVTDDTGEGTPTDTERIAKLETWARAWSANHAGGPQYA